MAFFGMESYGMGWMDGRAFRTTIERCIYSIYKSFLHVSKQAF